VEKFLPMSIWQTWYTTALATLAAIGVVAAAATRWGVYPIGVIVLLAAAVTGLLAVVVQRRGRGYDSLAHDHDAWVVSEVRAAVTRNDVRTLTEWDFGGSWRQRYIEPFMQLASLDDVEHRPRDEVLGDGFRALLDATHEFLNYYAYNTWPERGLPRDDDWRNVGWSGGEAESLTSEVRAKWYERGRQLESLADAIGRGYDDFIDRSRHLGLLVELRTDG
jgi:hypothetical protein